MNTDRKQVDLGTTVYDTDGDQLGTIYGFDEHGFYITAADGVMVLSEETVSSEHAAALTWRCWEEIYYWQED